jgi:hypothetical protein
MQESKFWLAVVVTEATEGIAPPPDNIPQVDWI